MSYAKNTINTLVEQARLIQVESVDDNDLTEILNALNLSIVVSEKFSSLNSSLDLYWNEIIAELLSVIHASISGYYRLALSGLRNVLELSCHVFYYYDHCIEMNISVGENSKSDIYPSSLVNNHDFYKSKYIKAFGCGTLKFESETDSFSRQLVSTYASLCDVVHGRSDTLLKKDGLSISYEKKSYKRFEALYLDVSSIISAMYIFRFNELSDDGLNNLSMRLNSVRGVL